MHVMSLGHLIVQDTNGVMSKGHRSKFEGTPTGQRWDNLGIKRNIDYSRFKHIKYFLNHEFLMIPRENHW